LCSAHAATILQAALRGVLLNDRQENDFALREKSFQERVVVPLDREL